MDASTMQTYKYNRPDEVQSNPVISHAINSRKSVSHAHNFDPKF